jgi:hypothetical protein
MLDHIVYAVPDLDTAIADLEHRLGIRATPGGKHTGIGTHNALLSLGNEAYLEIIGPDPDQPVPPAGRSFGIDQLTGPRIATWMAKAPDIEAMVEKARACGYALRAPYPRSRNLPDGSVLHWRLATPQTPMGDGILPSLIEWQTDRHPSQTSARGCTLVSFRAEHPRPEPLQSVLEALGLALEVSRASAPALIATIETPAGRVELR